MGLAFTQLAQTGADAWWLTLAKGNAWTQPLFAFYLARFADDPNASPIESQGGSMDIGFTNTTYYSGSIDYTALTSESYWLIPLKTINVNGKSMTSGTGAAIDTGTSLIGGPTSMMESIYAQIPGAQKGTGQLSQYYVYPCSTKVQVSLAFGTKTWSINSVDFSLPVQANTCAGAFFGLDINAGSTGLQWVVGDAFLKNVYSVYRYDPPSVGFAALNAAFGGSGGSSSPTGTESRNLPTDTGLPSGTRGVNSPTKSGNSPTSSSGSSGSSNARSLNVGMGTIAGAATALVSALVAALFVL